MTSKTPTRERAASRTRARCKLQARDVSISTGGMLLIDAMRGWQEEKNDGWGDSHRKCVRQHIATIEELMPKQQIADLRPMHVAALLKKLKETPVYANRVVTSAGAAWKWARVNGVGGVTGDSPFDYVEKFPERRPDYQVFDDLPTLLLDGIEDAERDRVVHPIICDLFRFAAATTRRASECARAQVDWFFVDENKPFMVVPAWATKIKKAQRVPLNELAVEVSRRRIDAAVEAETPWLFPAPKLPGKLGHISRLQAPWDRMIAHMAASGKPTRRSDGVTWKVKDLRAIGITLMSRHAPITAVAEAAGHLCVTTTFRYKRRDDAATREALDMFDEKYLDRRKQQGPALQVLGQRIRESRKKAGFNQEQLAEAVGVSRQTFIDYELGNVSIPVVSIIRIAAAVGKPDASDFLKGLTI